MWFKKIYKFCVSSHSDWVYNPTWKSCILLTFFTIIQIIITDYELQNSNYITNYYESSEKIKLLNNEILKLNKIIKKYNDDDESMSLTILNLENNINSTTDYSNVNLNRDSIIVENV